MRWKMVLFVALLARLLAGCAVAPARHDGEWHDRPAEREYQRPEHPREEEEEPGEYGEREGHEGER
jgi:hypothetical protein